MREPVEDGIGYVWRSQRARPVRAVLVVNGFIFREGPWAATGDEAIYQLALALGDEVISYGPVTKDKFVKKVLPQRSLGVTGGAFGDEDNDQEGLRP